LGKCDPSPGIDGPRDVKRQNIYGHLGDKKRSRGKQPVNEGESLTLLPRAQGRGEGIPYLGGPTAVARDFDRKGKNAQKKERDSLTGRVRRNHERREKRWEGGRGTGGGLPETAPAREKKEAMGSTCTLGKRGHCGEKKTISKRTKKV